MSFPHLIRFGVIVPCVALMGSFAYAQHGHGGGHGGGHMGGHVGGAHMGHVGGAHMGGVHHYSGYRGVGYGYGGYGLGYGGLYGLGGYGLGYGGYGLGYGGYGLGYGLGSYGGYGGYGYGYPSYGYSSYGYSSYPSYGYGSSIGVPAIPGVYSIPPQTVPSQPMTTPANPADPNPIPLPLPNGNNGNAGEPQPGTITVVTDEGATVTFDGIANDQKGTRHTFTTKPLAPGVETRVSVKVDGPNGPSTVSIGIRAGEKATVDMRK